MNFVVDCLLECVTILNPSIEGSNISLSIPGLEEKCLGQITKSKGRIIYKKSIIMSFAMAPEANSQELPLIISISNFTKTYFGNLNLIPGIDAAKKGSPVIVSSTMFLRTGDGRIGAEVKVQYCVDLLASVIPQSNIVQPASNDINYYAIVQLEKDRRNDANIYTLQNVGDLDEMNTLSMAFDEISDSESFKSIHTDASYISEDSKTSKSSKSSKSSSSSSSSHKSVKSKSSHHSLPEKDENENNKMKSDDKKPETKKEIQSTPSQPPKNLIPQLPIKSFIADDKPKSDHEEPQAEDKKEQSDNKKEKLSSDSSSHSDIFEDNTIPEAPDSPKSKDTPSLLDQSLRKGMIWKRGNKPEAFTRDDTKIDEKEEIIDEFEKDEKTEERKEETPVPANNPTPEKETPRVEFDIKENEDDSESSEFF